MIRNLAFLLIFSTLLLGIYSCSNENGTNEKQNVERVSYGPAYDSLTQLITENPGNAELYANRSKVLVELEEYDPAMSDINKAIELDSLQGKYYVNKAEIHIAQKQIGKAKMVLDDAIYTAPGSTDIMLKISEIYLWAGDYQKTINWANAALGFDQYLGQAYYLKGMAHEYSGDTVSAVSSFQTALEQSPGHYQAYMQLGKLYAIEKHELADAYFSNAIRVKPNSIEAYYARGLHRQELGRAEDALEDYHSILELEPNHVAATYNLGYVKLILLEQVDSAIIHFEKAANTAPEYADAKYMWGYCLELQGKNADALKMYKAVLKQEDTHTLAAKGLNRLTGQ